jgi:hypothetical protein
VEVKWKEAGFGFGEKQGWPIIGNEAGGTDGNVETSTKCVDGQVAKANKVPAAARREKGDGLERRILRPFRRRRVWIEESVIAAKRKRSPIDRKDLRETDFGGREVIEKDGEMSGD